jgi:hypothetical protein
MRPAKRAGAVDVVGASHECRRKPQVLWVTDCAYACDDIADYCDIGPDGLGELPDEYDWDGG